MGIRKDLELIRRRRAKEDTKFIKDRIFKLREMLDEKTKNNFDSLTSRFDYDWKVVNDIKKLMQVCELIERHIESDPLWKAAAEAAIRGEDR